MAMLCLKFAVPKEREERRQKNVLNAATASH